MAVVMEYLLREIPNDYRYKQNYLSNNAASIETLILGNSHAYYGVDPVYFNHKAFNAAHVSQSLDLDLEMFEKHMDGLHNLKHIILPVSYFSLFEQLKSSDESWRYKNYVLYADFPGRFLLTDYSELFTFLFRTNLYRITDHYVKGKSFITSSKEGWGTGFLSQNAFDLEKSAVKKASKHTLENINTPEIQHLFSLNLNALKKLLTICQERNIELILFTAPVSKAYFQRLNNEQLNTTINALELLSNASNNCRYLNLLQHESFSDSDFFDADHLSEIGAKKLSQLLNDELK